MNDANTACFSRKLNVMYNIIPVFKFNNTLDFPDSKVNRMSERHHLNISEVLID